MMDYANSYTVCFIHIFIYFLTHNQLLGCLIISHVHTCSRTFYQICLITHCMIDKKNVGRFSFWVCHWPLFSNAIRHRNLVWKSVSTELPDMLLSRSAHIRLTAPFLSLSYTHPEKYNMSKSIATHWHRTSTFHRKFAKSEKKPKRMAIQPITLIFGAETHISFAQCSHTFFPHVFIHLFRHFCLIYFNDIDKIICFPRDSF